MDIVRRVTPKISVSRMIFSGYNGDESHLINWVFHKYREYYKFVQINSDVHHNIPNLTMLSPNDQIIYNPEDDVVEYITTGGKYSLPFSYIDNTRSDYLSQYLCDKNSRHWESERIEMMVDEIHYARRMSKIYYLEPNQLIMLHEEWEDKNHVLNDLFCGIYERYYTFVQNNLSWHKSIPPLESAMINRPHVKYHRDLETFEYCNGSTNRYLIPNIFIDNTESDYTLIQEHNYSVDKHYAKIT